MRPRARHLAVFLKEPRLGRVKGRLARDIGRPEAWRFYRRLVRRVVPPLARDARWTVWLATTPARWRGREAFWPLALPRIEQGAGDLGRRMTRVFRRLPPGPAIVVGSDVPALAPGPVARAFAALGAADVALGPAEDGGFWLVGLGARARRLDLFRGVRWSTPTAFADTRRNVPATFRVAVVDRLADVDDGRSFRRWRAQASATHSISMSNSSGHEAMATKVRAGGCCGK